MRAVTAFDAAGEDSTIAPDGDVLDGNAISDASAADVQVSNAGSDGNASAADATVSDGGRDSSGNGVDSGTDSSVGNVGPCGLSWCPFSPAPPAGAYYYVWASGAHDIYLVGNPSSHWDGVAWTELPDMLSGPQYGGQQYTGGPSQAWGSSATDVWIAGSIRNGPGADYVGVSNWNGTTWSSPTVLDGTNVITSMWGSGVNDIWILSGNTAAPRKTWHGGGSGWTIAGGGGTAVGGTGPDDIWIVGSSSGMTPIETMHWDGMSWSSQPSAPMDGVIWATTPSDVWIAASTQTLYTVFHYDGSAWTAVTSLSQYQSATSIWADSASDVWVAESNGAMAHWDGSQWTESSIGASSLSWVYGLPSGEAWAVGGGQMFVHTP